MTNDTILQKTILEELGLQDLPPERQEALLDKIGEVIIKKIYIATMDQLEKEDQEKFAEYLDKDPEQIEGFIKEKIPNYEELIKKEVEKFREEMKADLAEVS
jgi:hypothetical protein